MAPKITASLHSNCLCHPVTKVILSHPCQECKGLEFNDVLLLDFFSSSTLGKRWRVAYNYLVEQLGGSCDEKYPAFNAQKHMMLVAELKELYVLVTRSKQRLLIYDLDSSAARPVSQILLLQVLCPKQTTPYEYHRTTLHSCLQYSVEP